MGKLCPDRRLVRSGFDARYARDYTYDTDLAFGVGAAGKRVRYEPAARVVHDDGGSAGTDLAAGAKAYQVRNRERFAAHRAVELRGHLPAGTLPSPATLHGGRRQVLVIDALTPMPDRDAGSLRLVKLMSLQRDEGAEVLFLADNRQYDGRSHKALQAS